MIRREKLLGGIGSVNIWLPKSESDFYVSFMRKYRSLNKFQINKVGTYYGYYIHYIIKLNRLTIIYI